MTTILMAIAIIQNGGKILLRRVNPLKNPYAEPWALVGGRIEGNGTIETLLNRELKARWNITVKIIDRLWWDEDLKTDRDGQEKRFIYIDALCELDSGDPKPVDPAEKLEWVEQEQLKDYAVNPPTTTVLTKMISRGQRKDSKP